MSKYTQEELLKYQNEINHFYRMRKLFLGLGWACIGTGLMLLFCVGVPAAINGNDTTLLAYLVSLFVVAGILLFILRGALFNRRIKNRKIIIQQAKQQYEIERMYKDNIQQ